MCSLKKIYSKPKVVYKARIRSFYDEDFSFKEIIVFFSLGQIKCQQVFQKHIY